MTAQALVIGVGAVTLILSAFLVAPGLFHDHLARTGENSPMVVDHAEEAFTSSFAIALVGATVTSLVAAGLVSWFLVRRVATPVEELAEAAQSMAAGDYDVDVPDAAFSAELQGLSSSFSHMARRLAETDATRTRLLADLAHELRTPLATLEAYIDGMEDGVVPEQPESWSTMRDQVSRLRRLATDLKEVAAAEEHALGITLRPMDLGTSVSAAVAAAAPRYQVKGVVLASAGTDRRTPVNGDLIRLQQVLANLLDNALRHTPTGGHVTVTMTVDAERAVVEVADDGDGIPVDQLDAVFTRFHRADPARVSADGSGSGLGLTIARAIATDHAGTLTAASDGPGHGATFTLTLPIR